MPERRGARERGSTGVEPGLPSFGFGWAGKAKVATKARGFLARNRPNRSLHGVEDGGENKAQSAPRPSLTAGLWTKSKRPSLGAEQYEEHFLGGTQASWNLSDAGRSTHGSKCLIATQLGTGRREAVHKQLQGTRGRDFLERASGNPGQTGLCSPAQICKMLD